MFNVYGTHTYGKTESVENCSIQTTFFMFNYIPLFPIRSHFVIEGTQHESHDLLSSQCTFEAPPYKNRFSLQSLTLTYARLFSIIITIYCLSLSLNGSSKDSIIAAALFLIALMPWFVFRKASRRISRICFITGILTGYYLDPMKTTPSLRKEILKTAKKCIEYKTTNGTDWSNREQEMLNTAGSLIERYIETRGRFFNIEQFLEVKELKEGLGKARKRDPNKSTANNARRPRSRRAKFSNQKQQ